MKTSPTAMPTICHGHISTPYWYISAVMPRIVMADRKDMSIETTVGTTASCRSAMMNSDVVLCRPPVSAWYTPMASDVPRNAKKMT